MRKTRPPVCTATFKKGHEHPLISNIIKHGLKINYQENLLTTLRRIAFHSKGSVEKNNNTRDSIVEFLCDLLVFRRSSS